MHSAVNRWALWFIAFCSNAEGIGHWKKVPSENIRWSRNWPTQCSRLVIDWKERLSISTLTYRRNATFPQAKSRLLFVDCSGKTWIYSMGTGTWTKLFTNTNDTESASSFDKLLDYTMTTICETRVVLHGGVYEEPDLAGYLTSVKYSNTTWLFNGFNEKWVLLQTFDEVSLQNRKHRTFAFHQEKSPCSCKDSVMMKAVGVPALVMRGESFSKCSGSQSHQELSFLRLPKRSSSSQGAYVCGLRFKYPYVQVILNDAKILHEAITDQDVIQNGRKFGTMNINGIKRFTRPLGAKVMETLVSIVKEKDIMARQEISEVNPVDVALRPHGYAKVALSPGKQFKSATLFYTKQYKPRGGQAQQCIHFFTVHLTEGNQTRRHNQIKDLKSRIDSLDPNLGCKTVLIGGDFNIGAPKLSIPKTREDAHFTIRTLSNMRFYDTGDTTEKDGDDKKESHYDHILVSDNTRLLHQYYPLVPPGERASKVYSTYIPISTQFRNTEPKIRSYDLSDHLPLRFRDSDNGAFVGTWNLRNFQVLSTGNSGRKEGLHKGIYEEVFAQFHILALQELSGTASNLYSKALIVSPMPNKETNKLGIAYDQRVLQVINCLDLPVSDPPGTPKPNKYRAMFGCTFQTANLERITVFSVHVKNENSKIKTSKLYRAHADEFAKANPSSGTGTGVGKVYLVGDFNADKPSGSNACIHRNNGGISPPLEYTLVTSKYIWDYVWHSENLLPGISGCQVLNPELMRDSSGRYIIEDSPNAISGSGMRVFATWKEISDHLPMIVEFKTE